MLSKFKYKIIESRKKILIFLICVSALFLVQYCLTVKIVKNNSPQIVVIDLAFLNQNFVTRVARYLSKEKSSQQQLQMITNQYLRNLEVILKDLDDKNYILIQKQMVVSNNLVDITQDVEKALFKRIIKNLDKN